MHSLVLSVPQDQHAQQLELLFSGRTRSAHLSHFHKDNTTKFELFVMIVVHGDPVAMIERANALLVLSINFY